MLNINNLKVKIEDKTIISDFSYVFEKGKVYAIMGPNGSGKSTLAMTIMGSPAYTVASGHLTVSMTAARQVKSEKVDNDSVRLNDLRPEERADAGIFMSFQSPISLSGIRVAQLLQLALKGKKSALQIRKEIGALAKELGIQENLLSRSLNEGLSGGERKKMEVLQAAILGKPIQIFDEIDTGVDVDALKSIANYLQKNNEDKTYIIITHYNRILKYLKPDRVLVLVEGKLVKEGDYTLAEKIEKQGYTGHLV